MFPTTAAARNAAAVNDGCRKGQRSVPQPPTTAAARNAATVSHRKTAPKTHPEKTGF
jgi:hypothetical protein